MSSTFVDNAYSQMGAVERLLKGLPGIKGYVDKDLRRDADKRVRDAIAAELDTTRSELLNLQQQLLKQSGLGFMTDMDTAITRLQTLADRVKHASYGYAGLFDPVRVKENELDALYRFDVAMVQEVGSLEGAVAALTQAIAENQNIAPTIARVTKTIGDLDALYKKRKDAIESPVLLDQAGYAPEVAAAPEPPATLPPAPPAA
jgi:hypothetical protein